MFNPGLLFSSTTVFVDDSQSFLEGFTLNIEDRYSVRLFDSPYEALQALQLSNYSQNLYRRCLSGGETSGFSSSRHQTLHFDLGVLHTEVYNMQRFSEVSVVVRIILCLG